MADDTTEIVTQVSDPTLKIGDSKRPDESPLQEGTSLGNAELNTAHSKDAVPVDDKQRLATEEAEMASHEKMDSIQRPIRLTGDQIRKLQVELKKSTGK